MDQREFYEMAMTPEFGNAMNFEITRDHPTPGTTFSMEAIEGVAQQIKNFMLARIVAHEDAGNPLPQRMSTKILVEFDGMPASEDQYGFYTAESGSQFLEIDGLRRLRGVDKPGE